MPVNELIARGITPALEGVPNVLFQIAQLREAKARDAEFAKRTEIMDREAAQNSAIRLAQLGWQADDRNRQMKEREDAERNRPLGEMLPAIEAGDPNAVNAAIEGISQHNPQLGEALKRDPKLLGPIIRRVIGEKGPAQITTQPLPGVGTAVLENGQLHSIDKPPSYAPERPAPLKEWTDSEGRLWQIDPSGRRQPQPVMAGQDVAGPRGGWVQRRQQLTGAKPGQRQPQPRWDEMSGQWVYPPPPPDGTEAAAPDVGGVAAALPEGVPAGSVQIGTSDGKPVYQSPDGKRWVVE